MSMLDLVGATCWLSGSGCGGADRSKFICCVDGRKPEVNEVWILGEYGVTPKVRPTALVDVDAEVVCKFLTNYLTANGFKTSIFWKNPLMEVLSFSEFLIHWVLTGPIILIIYWFLFRLGESVVLWKLLTGEVNLLVTTEAFPSRVVVPSMPVLFTSLLVRKICAPLRTVSVTVSFERTVWRASKVSLIIATSSVIVWSIGRIAPRMIFGMIQLRINLCGVLPLIVSLSVIFLSFPSLVWFSTNESLSRSLMALCSSES